jgi:hypothetical protein
MAWSYYDFDQNWNDFFAAWSSTEVQSVLAPDIKELCKSTGRTWRANEPLWPLSPCSYWSSDNIERFAHGWKHYRSAMQRAANIRPSHGVWADIVQERIHEELLPLPCTLESLALISGGEYIHQALLKTAECMFPDSRIFSVASEDVDYVVLADEKLILDLLGYYSYTRDRDDAFAPQRFYELLLPLDFGKPYQYFLP